MRNSQPVVRSALTAAAAALPLALAAVPAAAQGTGISVSTSGSTVSVTTSVCSQRVSGALGTATLLSSSQPSRQMPLSGTAALQSAAWSNVSPGTYTVTVVCATGAPAGTQSVVVSGSTTPTATPSTTPASTISATSKPSPSLGVKGGLGGTVQDYGPLTLGVGAALVGTGVIATGWYLRRRARPNRL